MFIAVLFIIAKTWKQPKFPSTGEWIKKTWYVHKMEYYSGLKKEGNSYHATWMNLENIMLIEISQT